jgi:hypothetical protein
LHSQLLLRSRQLRANGKYLLPESFAMRRHFFNNREDGVFEEKRQPGPPPNPMAMMSDPKMMQNMMKGNLLNMLPMMMIGGIVGWIFSGFVTSAFFVRDIFLVGPFSHFFDALQSRSRSR